MQDRQREILSQVAAGQISAEEGAARLEALDSPAAPPPSPAPAGARAVRVVSRLGNTEVIGDPGVDYAVADGPHRVRQDGDTMVIEQSGLTDGTFEFIRRGVGTSRNSFPEKLTIRMNPALRLAVRVQAGNVRVERIEGPLTADVQAGSCIVSDFRGPIKLAVVAGNLEASGRLDSGTSSIRCDMGEVRVNLARSSNVRINAQSTFGEIAIEGDDFSDEGLPVKLGSGAGTLDIQCRMGSVRVAVE